MTTTKKKTKTPVLVTTEHRGVFFGFLQSYDKEAKTAIITSAQCCIIWRGVKGFIDLAVNGPGPRCRVTPAAPEMTIEKVTSVVKCTKESVKAWEACPWD